MIWEWEWVRKIWNVFRSQLIEKEMSLLERVTIHISGIEPTLRRNNRSITNDIDWRFFSFFLFSSVWRSFLLLFRSDRYVLTHPSFSSFLLQLLMQAFLFLLSVSLSFPPFHCLSNRSHFHSWRPSTIDSLADDDFLFSDRSLSRVPKTMLFVQRNQQWKWSLTFFQFSCGFFLHQSQVTNEHDWCTKFSFSNHKWLI